MTVLLNPSFRPPRAERRIFNLCTMNKIYALAIATFYTLCLNAQNAPAYLLEYDMQTRFAGIRDYDATLQFNNRQAIFEYTDKEQMDKEVTETSPDDQTYEIKINYQNSLTVYVNKQDKSLLQVLPNPKGLREEPVTVRDTMPTIEWRITDEIKKIGPYECRAANGHLGGRNYVAWFTFAVPCNFGPYKLHGLPGAIVMAEDETGEVFFQLKKIRPLSAATLDFEIPKVADFQGLTEYQFAVENRMKEVTSRLASKVDRKFRVKSKIQFKALEYFARD